MPGAQNGAVAAKGDAQIGVAFQFLAERWIMQPSPIRLHAALMEKMRNAFGFFSRRRHLRVHANRDSPGDSLGAVHIELLYQREENDFAGFGD